MDINPHFVNKNCDVIENIDKVKIARQVINFDAELDRFDLGKKFVELLILSVIVMIFQAEHETNTAAKRRLHLTGLSL